MKKVFYLLIVILSISCSKNDEQPPLTITPPITTNPPGPLNEYKIENIFADTNPVNMSLLNDYIFFSGKLNNSQKFGFIGFDTVTKEKLFDLIPFEYTSITVDLPDGGEKQAEVSSINVFRFAENSSKSIVICLGVGDATSTFRESMNYIYFINDNEVSNIISPTIDNAQNIDPEIIIWGQNFLIGSKDSDKVILYSPIGEIIINGFSNIFSDYKKYFDYKLYTFDTLNEFEAIIIHSFHLTQIDPCYTYLSKLNLKEDDYTWSSRIELSKLDGPRIDSAKLIEKSDTHFTYELHYTEYSGNKGVIKFKINIATGEIEYL